MSKEAGKEMLVPTGLKTCSGEPIFLLYTVVPTKTGFDFYRECACLEDKTKIEFTPELQEKVGGVLDFKQY